MPSMMQSDSDLKPSSLLIFLTSQICHSGKNILQTSSQSPRRKETVLGFLGFYRFTQLTVFSQQNSRVLPHPKLHYHTEKVHLLIQTVVVIHPYCFIIHRTSNERSIYSKKNEHTVKKATLTVKGQSELKLMVIGCYSDKMWFLFNTNRIVCRFLFLLKVSFIVKFIVGIYVPFLNHGILSESFFWFKNSFVINSFLLTVKMHMIFISTNQSLGCFLGSVSSDQHVCFRNSMHVLCIQKSIHTIKYSPSSSNKLHVHFTLYRFYNGYDRTSAHVTNISGFILTTCP